jgi:yeast amino acid transporter
MLRLAGPVALILSFVLLSVLAWGVMQCIAEMLCIWPIPGALHQFVEKFVDREVGHAVGAAYWSVSRLCLKVDASFGELTGISKSSG